MGGVGAVAEPAAVIFLLFGGTYLNRNASYSIFQRKRRCTNWPRRRDNSRSNSADSLDSASSEDGLLAPGPSHRPPSPTSDGSEPKWHMRPLRFFGLRWDATSPNTRRFKHYFLSRLLLKFPFLVECWYWALIYWVYQLGRAFTAVTIVEGTVHVARRHALEIITLEQRLHIFHELDVQAFFLRHPFAIHWINRIYSFIHIPGTIAFLVWLYYYTIVKNRPHERQHDKAVGEVDGSPAGPRLYEARRRTMAVCNLLAFVIFTAYPCMPPRLLSDKSVKGPTGELARSYGFVDTVHGKGGESSVWTQNRFCNQYAAMPSLHFGYALLIGLTIALIPLSSRHRRSRTFFSIPLPSARRILCVLIGMSYILTILVAIVATANHFLLDAVAGACVCAMAWWWNGMLLNLLWVEDWFLWVVRIHRPSVKEVGEARDEEDDGERDGERGKQYRRYL